MTLNCQLFGWIRDSVLGGGENELRFSFFFVVRRQKLRRRCSAVEHFVFTACLAAASEPANGRRGFTPTQAEALWRKSNPNCERLCLSGRGERSAACSALVPTVLKIAPPFVDFGVFERRERRERASLNASLRRVGALRFCKIPYNSFVTLQ